ncbi:restriction endonuclease subunit S [Lacticaseibacillus paracasei subsp. tolerans]|uniref:restriction endonuclease subunit S n=1 Tax=Lacticaseibacillus paracasei TaxID=1597 RepID=UPI001892C877|nr:restriction endonuclease subunit S [Lacticaseibacillus paracasei]QPC18688.1 restriction endonuclease subunit S [Lacticaseibacillus paracasei subsp. tolerans]
MSKDVKNVPALRFKGYSDAWEKRKLKELGDTYSGLSGKTKEDFGHGEARYVTYMNVFTNPVADPVGTETTEIDTRQNEVKKNDVFFTTSSETPGEVGMSSVWPIETKNVYLNSFCFGYRILNQSSLNFLFIAQQMRSPSFRKRIIVLAQGISRYNISKKKVLEIPIFKPSLNEQNKIGHFLSNVDVLIAATQRRIDDLEQVEKTLLQHLFDQSWRFNVYSDPWVKSKVANMAKENFGGGTPSTKKRSFWTGSLPWIQSSDLDKSNKYTVIPKKFISSAALKSSAAKKVPSNSIAVVTRVGVGKLAFINYDYATSQDFLSFSFLNWSAFFSVNLLTRVMEQMSNEGQGTSIKGVTKSELLAKSVLIPTSLEEQISIGNLLKSFDDLIKSTSNRLSKLELLKTSLLKNLFV